MGERKKKLLSHKAIIAKATRCIYCEASKENGAKFDIEHMPPIGMFIGRDRAKGMEFASCQPCNGGSKQADTVASLMSLINPYDRSDDPLLPRFKSMMNTADVQIPGLRAEIMEGITDRKWTWTPDGLVQKIAIANLSGPLVSTLLNVFASKIGMALYHEHVGEPLPLDGAVYASYALNGGIEKDEIDAYLSIMPMFGQLTQGKKTSYGQFQYRHNTDNKSVLAAVVSLHDNLIFKIFVTSMPDYYGEVFEKFPGMRKSAPTTYIQPLQALGLPSNGVSGPDS